MAGRYQRLMAAPKGSFFLFGVRGIGKSTWTRAAFPDAHVIDLLDESRYQALTANPGLLALEFADDEIHRLRRQLCGPRQFRARGARIRVDQVENQELRSREAGFGERLIVGEAHRGLGLAQQVTDVSIRAPFARADWRRDTRRCAFRHRDNISQHVDIISVH